ncbi:MAG: response regulator, partial [Chitinivibrionales bacterium]|nr:response regulator [Chitinivibrionales bacterium]
VRQILTFSRQSKSEKRRLQVSLVVKEALKLLRPSLPATIEIRQRIDRTLGPIVGDPTQVHQVLMNLCTNAAHAMRGRHGQLAVTLEEVEIEDTSSVSPSGSPPGRYVRLQVADTGVGMPPEVVERVFEPFFTTKEPGEGTGMGLSVVHGIVEDHGGFIDIDSVPDTGTTMSIYLPVDTSAADDTEEPSVAEQRRGTERVLLVDDEQMLVDLGAEMLTGLGYAVAAFSDSELALREYQVDPSKFDVLVTDLTMPRLTGLQLAEECKNLRPEIPVVLCTGYTDAKLPKVGKGEAVQAVITKPLIRRVLGNAVREALDA